jgi:hypothetical protein
MDTRTRWTRLLAAAAVTVAALALAGAALADREKVHITPADQAAARAAVLRRADLGPAGGWTGTSKKPKLSTASPCPGYEPKQSDLVVTGAAETVWKHTGLQFDSEADVLRTARMVDLDWKRTIVAPQLIPCLRGVLAKTLGARGHLVSFGRIAVPGVVGRVRAFRAVIDVSSGTAKIRMMADMLFVGHGRTELSLAAMAPLAIHQLVEAAESRLLRVLVARARA